MIDAALKEKFVALARYGCPSLDAAPLAGKLWALADLAAAGAIMALARPPDLGSTVKSDGTKEISMTAPRSEFQVCTGPVNKGNFLFVKETGAGTCSQTCAVNVQCSNGQASLTASYVNGSYYGGCSGNGCPAYGSATGFAVLNQ